MGNSLKVQDQHFGSRAIRPTCVVKVIQNYLEVRVRPKWLFVVAQKPHIGHKIMWLGLQRFNDFNFNRSSL